MNGSYRVHVELPAGYRASENDFLYEVANQINFHLLSFVKASPEEYGGAIVAPVDPATPVAPVLPTKPTVQPTESESKESDKVKPVAVTYHTGAQEAVVTSTPVTGLPKTGQEDLVSTVLSLLGMTSLAVAGFVARKKREEN